MLRCIRENYTNNTDDEDGNSDNYTNNTDDEDESSDSFGIIMLVFAVIFVFLFLLALYEEDYTRSR